MSATIRLPEALIQRARAVGKIEHRKPAQQIEYWIHLAQCALDNPDMTMYEIRETLEGLAELDAGMGTEFTLDEL
jgi:hypothetical protein